MEGDEALETSNAEREKPEKKYLWTIGLFLLSLISAGTIICIIQFTGKHGIPDRDYMAFVPMLALTTVLSNLVGFIVGFIERKRNKRLALFGRILNGLAIAFYIVSLTVLANIASNIKL